MYLCPECKSDHVEKTYSIGLRVIVCIILLFIPYGILICWVPFVFPYKYICYLCGTETVNDQMLQIDWREREELAKEFFRFEEKIDPLLGEWIEDQDGRIFKVAKGKGQFFLVEVKDIENVTTHRIVDYIEEPNTSEIKASSKVGVNYRRVLQNDPVDFSTDISTTKPDLTDLGKELLTEDEHKHIIDRDLDLNNWLKNLPKNQQEINVEFLLDQEKTAS
ncbi:hypothetical protein [Aquisalibacillus elongatus]|uniref:Uncharacterized protein n=1 Tax=Aquisalibacillus elongatus TaxID=485577 RepID=A0A3N5BQM9_9BACI|nr:hypothetical protein [Aquisalibacillus elongatus]RPF52078.1 hypothetical protein EDC24_2068 [Aquisalibacillus elongatus]